jgi:nucleotide-binding universal stress UspA family protein
MALVDILLHVRRVDGPSVATDTAIELSRRFDAHLTALYCTMAAPATFAVPAAAARAPTGERDAGARQQADWLKQLAERGVRGELIVAQGDPAEAICHSSRWMDLIVIERPSSQPEAPVGWGVVSRTIFSCSTPVLAIPDTVRGMVRFDRIVVAWNGSAEAARAVHGAMPLLQRAAQVIVLEGHPTLSWSRQVPRLDLRRFFARHFVEAEFRDFDAEGRDTGGVLIDTADSLEPDLLVMGAWGHSRLSQMVLGGSTREVLQHATFPLLLAH